MHGKYHWMPAHASASTPGIMTSQLIPFSISTIAIKLFLLSEIAI